MDSQLPAITARNLKFKVPKVTSRYWFNGSAVETLHINTLNNSIPYGERFFVEAVLPYIKHLKDKTLKKNAIQFVRQEMNHSKEHFRLYLKAIKPFYPRLKIRNDFYQKIFLMVAFFVGRKIRLAMVAAMEHFTAVAGELYLGHPEYFNGVDEKITLLWQWHFIEEIEHKAVVFDIFQAVGGNYIQRIIGFLITGTFFNVCFANYYLHMVCYDKLYKSKQFYVDVYHFFWGKKGLIRKIIGPFLRYLLPGFHPNKLKNAIPLQDRMLQLLFIQQQIEKKGSL